jgi:hypothetical protein
MSQLKDPKGKPGRKPKRKEPKEMQVLIPSCKECLYLKEVEIDQGSIVEIQTFCGTERRFENQTCDFFERKDLPGIRPYGILEQEI